MNVTYAIKQIKEDNEGNFVKYEQIGPAFTKPDSVASYLRDVIPQDEWWDMVIYIDCIDDDDQEVIDLQDWIQQYEAIN
jgi:hypothetical protein